MKNIFSFFNLDKDKVKEVKEEFLTKEDRTIVNNLLKQLLDDKSIVESIELKKTLDEEYYQIMVKELKQKDLEIKSINNYLQLCNKKSELEKEL